MTELMVYRHKMGLLAKVTRAAKTAPGPGRSRRGRSSTPETPALVRTPAPGRSRGTALKSRRQRKDTLKGRPLKRQRQS